MLEPGRMSGGHFLERIREAQVLERIRGGQFLELIRAGQFPERRSCCLLRVLRMCKLADPGQFQGRVAFLARCVHVGLGLEQLAEAGVVAVLRLMYQGRQAAVAGRLHDGRGREERGRRRGRASPHQARGANLSSWRRRRAAAPAGG